jgi:chromosome partitioning protein
VIIAVVNLKGGCGKTTIATNLAALFASDGQDVLLVDADPEQHSARNWSDDRPETLPKIQSVILPAKSLRREVEQLRKKYSVIIIDGGARVTDHARAAVEAADWLIIPVKPSKVDLDATAEFLDLVTTDMARRDNLKGGLLLNQIQEGTAIGNAARQQIAEWSFPVFDTALHSYVAFAEALWQGQSVIEYAPSSKAAANFLAFFKELKGAIKKK